MSTDTSILHYINMIHPFIFRWVTDCGAIFRSHKQYWAHLIPSTQERAPWLNISLTLPVASWQDTLERLSRIPWKNLSIFSQSTMMGTIMKEISLI